MVQITIIGDSITWGAWDYKELGWANRLRKYIESKFKTEYLVYNLGISGDTTVGLLKRLDAELELTESDIVLFAIGINDSLFYKDSGHNLVNKEVFENNLNEIIKVTRKYLDKIIFIGLTKVEDAKLYPFPLSTSGKCYNNKNVKQYDKIIKSIANEQGIKYIEMFDLLNENDLSDGLHPNSKGHEKMFEKIKVELEENL